jgi:NTP pyrophosphatase (non-canonical NTP hydrolase)
MKITREQLKKIIKEEYRSINLREGWEVEPEDQSLEDLTSKTMEIAKSLEQVVADYAESGWLSSRSDDLKGVAQELLDVFNRVDKLKALLLKKHAPESGDRK